MYKDLIQRVKCEIVSKGKLASHDYYHSMRVFNNATYIAECEKVGGDIKLIAQVSALLHDIGHKKKSFLEKDSHELDDNDLISDSLAEYGVDDEIIDRVLFCVNNHRYSGDDSIGSDRIELQILRDADRLDALGAIAIARTFSYDSDRPIYIPEDKPKEVYDGISNSSMNHIIEKILKLTPESFYMDASREIAAKRLKFVQDFVDEFFVEWNGVSGGYK